MINKALKEIAQHQANKEYDKAIALALQGFKLFKDNCFYNEIVNCYTAEGKIKDAIKYLKLMIKTEKDNMTLYNRLAYNYFLINDYKKALKYYKILLDTAPYSSTYNFNVGNMYHFLKDYPNAYKYYDFAIKTDPTNLSALNDLGLVYYETGNWEESMKIFNRAMKISSTHPEAYHHLGIVYRDFANDLELSELYLKKAIRLDPKHVENTYQLALTYLKENKQEQAIACANKCLEMNSKHKGSIKLLKSLTV